MKYLVSLKGKTYEVEVEHGEASLVNITDTLVPAAAPAVPASSAAPAPATAKTAPTAEGEPISAPMSGAIVSVKVQAGQAVKKGELVALLEAMKMENEIFAPRDGTVTQVVTEDGAKVRTGDPIILLK